MATFWRRIREMFYGSLADDGDQEIGWVHDGTEPVTGTKTDPVHMSAYGGMLSVLYTGPLSQTGRPIYLHFGYGPGAWRDVGEARMHQVDPTSFEAEIPVRSATGVLEFCFRNDLGEWDNNDGNNWSHPL